MEKVCAHVKCRILWNFPNCVFICVECGLGSTDLINWMVPTRTNETR